MVARISLTARAAKALLFLGAPILLLHCCDYVSQQVEGGAMDRRDLMCLDLFSGMASVATGFHGEKMKSSTYDQSSNPEDEDILTVPGFLRALLLTLRLAQSAVLSSGPPCSSFVFLNMSTSGRRKWRPFGFAGRRPYVCAANRITTRMVLLWLVATVRYVYLVTEQPLSSLMPWFPYVQFFRRMAALFVDHHHVTFNMGADGAPTLKPTMIWGTAPLIPRMAKRTSKAVRAKLKKNKKEKKVAPLVKKTVSASGKVQVTGAAALKASQIYPRKYGVSMARHHKKFLDSGNQNELAKAFGPDLGDCKQVFKAPYGWRHANLQEIKVFLQKEVKEGRFTPQFDYGLFD